VNENSNSNPPEGGGVPSPRQDSLTLTMGIRGRFYICAFVCKPDCNQARTSPPPGMGIPSDQKNTRLQLESRGKSWEDETTACQELKVLKTGENSDQKLNFVRLG
jgi:hypothetical protein